MNRVISLLLASAIAGCSWLPAQGPTASAIGDQATVDGRVRFTVVEVDDHIVDTLLKQPAPSFQSHFGRFGRPAAPAISIGDSVVVSIWEGGDETLFGTALTLDHGVTTGSHAVTLPEQIVPPDGMVTVPFVGRVFVKDRTSAQAQEQIRALLVGKTASPQVIVAVSKSVFNTVTVSGEVVKGARVPLSTNGDKILDVIAVAGGAAAPVYDVYVRLSRNGITTTIPYETLVANPAENVYVWPGDVLTLVRIPQTFVAFGATGKNAQINFEQEKLNASQALAKSAGLLDERADPAGIFLLREEPGPLLRQFGQGAQSEWVKPLVPVVYHFDLRDAKTFFLAQHFPVENNDVLYVAPAQASGIQKFFGILATISNPIVTGVVVSSQVP